MIAAVTGAVVIAAAVAVTGFWKPGFFVTHELDVKAAQTAIQGVISDKVNGFGLDNATGVVCNDGKNPRVHPGATFTCQVVIDGKKRQIVATFDGDRGAYHVGAPK